MDSAGLNIKFICISLLLLITPLYHITISSATVNSTNQIEKNMESKPSFLLTGQNSFENFDYNHDGHDDIVLATFGINVTNPGLFVFQELCLQNYLYWNATSSNLSDRSQPGCYTPYTHFDVLNLNNEGLMNLTFWIGYSTFYLDESEKLDNLNVTVSFQLNPLFSNGSTSPESTILNQQLTLYQFHTFSINYNLSVDFGIANSISDWFNNDITYGKSLNNTYAWKFYYNTSFQNISGYVAFKFTNISQDLIEYKYNPIVPHGFFDFPGISDPLSGFLPSEIYSLPEKGVTNNPLHILHFFIPQNVNVSILKSMYQVIWIYYLCNVLAIANNYSNESIFFNVSKEIFESNFSINYQDIENGDRVNYYDSFFIKFNLTDGLLDAYNFLIFKDGILSSNITFTYTTEKLPDTSITSSNLLSYGEGDPSFNSGPLILIIPLAVYAIYSRKDKLT